MNATDLRAAPGLPLSGKPKPDRSSWTGWLLVFPTIAFLLFWTVYPLIYAVYVSLTNLHLARHAMQKFVGLLNYRLILQDDTFLATVWHTLWLTVVRSCSS